MITIIHGMFCIAGKSVIISIVFISFVDYNKFCAPVHLMLSCDPWSYAVTFDNGINLFSVIIA